MDPTHRMVASGFHGPQPQRGAGQPDFVTMNVGAKWFGGRPIGWESSGRNPEWDNMMKRDLREVAEGIKHQALRFSSP